MSNHEAYRIPLHAFRVSNDDGGFRTNITREQVRAWVRKANEVFQPAGVSFEFRGVRAGLIEPWAAGLNVDFADIRSTTLNNLGHRRGNLNVAADVTAQAIAAAHRSKLVVFFRTVPSWTGIETASDAAEIEEGQHVEVSFSLNDPGAIVVTGGADLLIVVRNTPPVITRDENLVGRIELFAPGQSQPVATTPVSDRLRAPRLAHRILPSDPGLGGAWRARFTHLDSGQGRTNTRVDVSYPGGIVNPTRCACSGFSAGPEHSNYVAMPGFWTMVCQGDTTAERQNIGLLAHEIGHYFGLDHTHKMEFETVAAAEGYLESSRARPEDIFNGDGLASTPLDPFIAEKACRTAEDPYRVVLAERSYPLPRSNIMSYYDDDNETLTYEQVDKVRRTARARGQLGLRLTATDSFPPVLDPSTLGGGHN